MIGMSPEESARTVRHNLGMGYGPLNLAEVCRELSLQVIEEDLGPSGKAAGILVRSGKRGIILVNKNIHYEPRKRFTIGHEIGHFSIPSHTENQYECIFSDIETFHSNKAHETEANRFSSELLLPAVKAAEILKQSEIDIPLVSKVADDFGISLSATTIKLVKQSGHDTCAAILSTDNSIKWSCESTLFARKWQLRRKGLPIPSSTVLKYKGDPRDWIYGEKLLELREVWLEHVSIGNNMVLTLITIPFNDHYEDDSDEYGEY